MNDPLPLSHDILVSIDVSLKQISNSLGHIVTTLENNRDKTQVELVELLLGLGYDRTQVAGALNTTVPTVTARIADIKKKAEKT